MSSKSKKILFIALAVVALFGLVIYRIISSGITAPLDNKFGDQHLKTSVALIEMHKLRYGAYPESLSDLKHVGEWDKIALQSVDYFSNCDHTKYFVEVSRGWVAKPTFVMESDFWQGTGYAADLKRCEK